MERQRNTTQMKEQTRNRDIQINEEEIGELPEKEFRIVIVCSVQFSSVAQSVQLFVTP